MTNRNHSELSEIIGRAVADFRREAGLRQQDIVSAARLFGLNWARSSVTDLEAGRRIITVDELVLLPLILESAAGGASVPSVTDLLTITDGRAILGNTTVDPGTLKALVEGGEGAAEPGPGADMNQLIAQAIRRQQRTKAEDRGSEAEQKAARRLGISVDQVLERAQKTWDRTLTAERDARLAATGAQGSSVAAKRGHITRQLLAEITED